MPLEEKRKHYKGFKFYTVDNISAWQDYFLESKERLKAQCKLLVYIVLFYMFCKFFCLCFEETL
jgi:hypothetical protein